MTSIVMVVTLFIKLQISKQVEKLPELRLASYFLIIKKSGSLKFQKNFYPILPWNIKPAVTTRMDKDACGLTGPTLT